MERRYDAPKMVTWKCGRCGQTMRQPAGLISVSHPCPKDMNRRHWLRKVR